jgi:acyl-CoA thioester hydrolase
VSGKPEEAKPWAFSIAMEVRDYELDLQGIVNNGVYLNYFEHARHAFLKSRGLDFAKMHDEGIDAVVHHIELDYRDSLRSGDSFEVRLRVEREGRLRIVFVQEAAKAEGKVAAMARVTAVLTRAGRPVPPDPQMALRLFGEAGGS